MGTGWRCNIQPRVGVCAIDESLQGCCVELGIQGVSQPWTLAFTISKGHNATVAKSYATTAEKTFIEAELAVEVTVNRCWSGADGLDCHIFGSVIGVRYIDPTGEFTTRACERTNAAKVKIVGISFADVTSESTRQTIERDFRAVAVLESNGSLRVVVDYNRR